MATIRKRVNKKGVSWQVDYYDPRGKRVMKCFRLKKDAETYLSKVLAAKREWRYYLAEEKLAAEALASRTRGSLKDKTLQLGKDETVKRIKEWNENQKQKLWTILSAINDLGKATSQKEIAEKTGIRSSDVSTYIREANDMGLITRDMDPQYPGLLVMQVTKRGLQYLQDWHLPNLQATRNDTSLISGQELMEMRHEEKTSQNTDIMPSNEGRQETKPLHGILEEIILRQTRTIERLLEEHERLKQENERLSRRAQQLTLENDELLNDNLKLEDEVKKLKEQIESYQEEVKQLRDIRMDHHAINLPQRVAHAMAVFGD